MMKPASSPSTPELPAEELERRKRSRVIRRVVSKAQQDEETLLYWQGRTSAERLEAAFQMTRAVYIGKGHDAASLGRSERLITRVQR